MERLNSIEDLRMLRGRLDAAQDPERPTVIIPAGTCCQASGANDLIRAAKQLILARGLSESLDLRITGCHGFCEMEPSVLVEPGRIFYPRLKPSDMGRVLAAAAVGAVVEDLLYEEPGSGKRIACQDEIPFFSKQQRVLLGQSEQLDPIRIYNYIERGGYLALAGALTDQQPLEVVSEVKKSGIRGRGGAGFPTGVKWELLAAQKNGTGKFLVCNADEGDPGAYMDRSLLEGNPHSVIEGMLLGAFATGADRGVVYVRDEYPLAIKHLLIALRQAGDLGLLGKDVLGTGFGFNIDLVRGAGAFVCGEETALIRSVEGKMGEPRQRPPFPIEKGIEGKPTAINNVETWANIPVVLRHGAEAFTQIGTKGNSGTKIFSLVGKVRHTGLVEVPMGTTLSGIVFDIGGGPVGKGEIKAVQTGGPSGGCIPAGDFDLRVDYDSLGQAGSIMGSGGLIVMDQNTCMVDLARYFMGFLKDESCGKCFSCRKGTQRMYEILDEFSKGQGDPKEIDLLEELALVVKDSTMCGLGHSASNPVLSTLRYFRDEYLAHIEEQRCPAGVCKELITYSINDACTGCMVCQRACPEKAIAGDKKQAHVIDKDLCIRCGACRSVCKFDAIEVF